ncbi:MAG: hypothetical protein WBP13_09210 [Methylophilaceae bacterium]
MSKGDIYFSYQEGGALLIFMLVLVLAGLAATFSFLDSSQVKLERIKANAIILANAKEALIGNSVAVNGSQRPGLLIKPDSFALGELPLPGNYDGTADSGCLDVSKTNGFPLIGSSNINIRCLGRLPWKDLGLSIHGATQEDASGIMPWYAVSANLVDPVCLGALNSNTLNLVHNPASLNCTGTALPYPWLTVRDGRGNIVSNRVAAVIIIPNEARNGQVRTLSPLGMANQYLDTLVVPVGCTAPCVPGTYSNADMDNDYIFSEEGNPFAIDSQFNDQLIYITIDELMAAVEKRVAQEAALALRNYYMNSDATPANRFYPYAATLGDVNNACVSNKLTGLMPLQPASASCISATACTVSFPMTRVEYNLNAGNYTSRSNACSVAANICTCIGAGSCNKSSAPSSVFTCDALGNCASTGTNPSGIFQFTYTPTAPDTTVTTGTCSGGAGSVACNGLGTFFSTPSNCAHSKLGISTLPVWFTDNRWQDFVTYHLSGDCTFANPGCLVGNLMAGSKANVHALLISAGPTLATQSRPSSLISDYLDSVENTNGDNVYDAVGTPRTNTYNDQMFIVAP